VAILAGIKVFRCGEWQCKHRPFWVWKECPRIRVRVRVRVRVRARTQRPKWDILGRKNPNFPFSDDLDNFWDV